LPLSPFSSPSPSPLLPPLPLLSPPSLSLPSLPLSFPSLPLPLPSPPSLSSLLPPLSLLPSLSLLLPPPLQLSQRAREIYNSYLSSKATTPVNIDSQAQLADDILNAPRPDMFKEQQLQIFNLMKFDSYTRFLKSLLYQECMLAEVEGKPLPDPYHIPSSPTSKHSTGSDRSTPKKVTHTHL
uniref:RGS domain-containing protein n=2 Tax=Hucho hucho TaxID=62062 RepID=A0A4W5M0X7_9TELE